MGGKWKPEYERGRGRRAYRGKARGRPRSPIDPDATLVRLYIRTPSLWQKAQELAQVQGYEFTWFVEAAITDLVKKLSKRMRSVELSMAGLSKNSDKRPANTIPDTGRRVRGQGHLDLDAVREQAKGWVQDHDNQFKSIADKLSRAGKQKRS